MHRSYAVIGLGAFGSTLASELARFGNYVLGIDIDEGRVARLSDTLAEAKIVDATDETALREAGVGRLDVVVVGIGRDLEASIVATMNARLVGCATIWAKAVSRTHHRILVRMGAARVIQPEFEIGQHTAQMLNNPALRDYFSLGNGYHMVNMVVPAELDGKRLDALRLADRYQLRPMGLMRHAEFHSCETGDLILQKDDKLLILGKRPELRRFGDTL